MANSRRTLEHAGQRETLSQSLLALLQESDARSVTFNDLLNRTRGRGLYLVMILLSVPFVTPVPLPGLSTVLGLAIAMLAARLAMRLPPALPGFIGTREISRARLRSLIRSSTRLLRFLEKLARPRHAAWMESRAVRFTNAALLVLMALLLALPIPPVIPFSNSLPSWAIIFISLALMEGDGILVCIGYGVAVGTSVYLIFFTNLIVAALHRALDLWQLK